jgi:Glucose / Sorbosone dehydrogenase
MPDRTVSLDLATFPRSQKARRIFQRSAWLSITYDLDYSGAKIGKSTAKAGMEQPVCYWDPVIAPSGMTF